MRIIHVGASGVIGKAVSAELARRHDLIAVGRSAGDFQVDIDNPSSISRMFSQIGEFDALVCTAGTVHFAPLAEFTIEQYAIGLQSKLMGQVKCQTWTWIPSRGRIVHVDLRSNERRSDIARDIIRDSQWRARGICPKCCN